MKYRVGDKVRLNEQGAKEFGWSHDEGDVVKVVSVDGGDSTYPYYVKDGRDRSEWVGEGDISPVFAFGDKVRFKGEDGDVREGIVVYDNSEGAYDVHVDGDVTPYAVVPADNIEYADRPSTLTKETTKTVEPAPAAPETPETYTDAHSGVTYKVGDSVIVNAKYVSVDTKRTATVEMHRIFGRVVVRFDDNGLWNDIDERCVIIENLSTPTKTAPKALYTDPSTGVSCNVGDRVNVRCEYAVSGVVTQTGRVDDHMNGYVGPVVKYDTFGWDRLTDTNVTVVENLSTRPFKVGDKVRIKASVTDAELREIGIIVVSVPMWRNDVYTVSNADSEWIRTNKFSFYPTMLELVATHAAVDAGEVRIERVNDEVIVKNAGTMSVDEWRKANDVIVGAKRALKVGDRVRVAKSDYWKYACGVGAEGTIVSLTSEYEERPIVVILAKYGDRYLAKHPGSRPNEPLDAWYAPDELEVIG